ncbi:MAG: type II and III secretion system protein family protein [Vicinamibacterales bacterium]
MTSIRVRPHVGFLFLLAIVWSVLGAPMAAQAPPPAAQPAQAYPRLQLTTGRSMVLIPDFDVTRIAITNPAIADATVVQPREILIDGKAPGTISLIVWGAVDQRVQYDLVVEQPVPALEQQLRQLFPGEEIQVTLNADALVLSGRVSSTQTMLRAADIARASAPKGNVINMLQVPGAIDAQQVMLQVRFAEVNRRALTDLGVSIFTGPNGARNWIARGTTQQFPAPELTGEELVLSDFLNIFLFNTNYNVGAVIRALRQTGYFQSLAEPNLLAYNNREASFLAGGEFPVPFSTGLGAVAIQFREFGVRLNFTPTIAGDLIKLRVRPEVSALDFNNGILLEGFRIPALTVRRAETEVELRDGQSFAIAGLLDNISQSDQAAIPVLSQLPIIGNLFKSKADRQERTELLVLITPRLVRALDPDEVPALPTLPGRFLPPGDEIGQQLEGGGGAIDGPAI